MEPTYYWIKTRVEKIHIGTEAKGLSFKHKNKTWGFGCINKDFDINVGDKIKVMWAHGRPSIWEKV